MNYYGLLLSNILGIIRIRGHPHLTKHRGTTEGSPARPRMRCKVVSILPPPSWFVLINPTDLHIYIDWLLSYVDLQCFHPEYWFMLIYNHHQKARKVTHHYFTGILLFYIFLFLYIYSPARKPDHITEAMRSIFRFLRVTQLRSCAPSRDYTVATAAPKHKKRKTTRLHMIPCV